MVQTLSYDEKTAEETYMIAKHFHADATILLSTLEKKINE